VKSSHYVAATALSLAIGRGTNRAFDGVGTRPRAPSVPDTPLDGTRHNTAMLRGKVVLINFWATSCTTCVKETPQIVVTHE
jgi:thiol-disulfide isomerase/thioredoxin